MPGRVLDGKRIIIIGGTSGIGLSGARACLAAGATLTVLGKPGSFETSSWENDVGARVFPFEGEASDPEVIEEVFELAAREMGGVDGLYHVAGGSGRRFGDGPLHEVTDLGWKKTFELNLDSVFLSNRAAVRTFLEQGSPGVILNVSSVLASSPAPRYFSTHSYAVAKAAIVGLSRSSAAYYAPYRIRINVVAPGLIQTPMSSRAQEDEGAMEYMSFRQPLGRKGIGTPQDLDAAVVYLLSDSAAFVTGQVLAIDGGWCVSDGDWNGRDR